MSTLNDFHYLLDSTVQHTRLYQDLKARYKSLRRPFRDLTHMLLTGAPAFLYGWKLFSTRGLKGIEARYAIPAVAWQQKISTLQFSNTWFLVHVKCWMHIIDLLEFEARLEKLRVLEIGSWEGVSTRFILDNLKGAEVTCVDTWQGADEHKDGSAAELDVLAVIETRFDANVKQYAAQVKKWKGTSWSFFYEHREQEERYDLIYVDGSHHVDDVYLDAVCSFKLLKPGGVLIFDDYYFVYYSKRIENPAFAINNFLRVYAGKYKMLLFSRQVIIQKNY